MEAKATYAGKSGQWRGAIRVGKQIVWTCPHFHKNRDQTTYSSGRAACACAKAALIVAKMSDDEVAAYRAANRQYMSASNMSPRAKWDISFELAVRDEIRAVLK